MAQCEERRAFEDRNPEPDSTGTTYFLDGPATNEQVLYENPLASLH